jgi:hypothetical protein
MAVLGLDPGIVTAIHVFAAGKDVDAQTNSCISDLDAKPVPVGRIQAVTVIRQVLSGGLNISKSFTLLCADSASPTRRINVSRLSVMRGFTGCGYVE